MSSSSIETKEKLPGTFITFEGGDGAGKSTHIAFLAYCLRQAGHEVLSLREPGGTQVGEDLRTIVLNPDYESIADTTELLMYEAARAQIVAEVIRPALSRGATVLCDRFYDSTVAYQGYGRGLSLDFIAQANQFACGGVQPDRTILMISESAQDGLERATDDGADRLERAGLDFHERVNQAFLTIAAEDPERVRLVYFQEKKTDTARAVFDQISDLFPDMKAAAENDPAFFERAEHKELYKPKANV